MIHEKSSNCNAADGKKEKEKAEDGTYDRMLQIAVIPLSVP
jgi:hypothetical protein